MATNIDNPKEQIKQTAATSVTEPILVGKYEDPEDQEELEIDVDEDEELEEEPEQEDVSDTDEEEDDSEEEPEQPAKKSLTKEQRQTKALKQRAKQLQDEKAELERKLAEKTNTTNDKEDELYSQYLEEHDEKEARKLAKKDIKQSTMESQLELLLFEKKNRKVLAQYPDSEDDLEKIMQATKTGVMTIDQVCRGIYGEKPEREVRAIKALTDTGEETETNNSVSRSMRTATTQNKVKLTSEQEAVQKYLQKRFKKKVTAEQVIGLEK